jgi:hypothetical protein
VGAHLDQKKEAASSFGMSVSTNTAHCERSEHHTGLVLLNFYENLFIYSFKIQCHHMSLMDFVVSPLLVAEV